MYKAFEDHYRELDIKHLLLAEHDGELISPPFATELCKDYSKVAVFGNSVSYIDLDLPPVTSKINATARVNDSTWLIPYGYWDEFRTVVELKGSTPIYHTLDKGGMGQFYGCASNGTTACSFPLGTSNTSFLLYIDEKGLHTKDFDAEMRKSHMGTAYCNGRYWSMPRGDFRNYNVLVSYDGKDIEKYPIPVDHTLSRKFTDLIPVGNTLYSLPYGETAGLTQVVEFNTEYNSVSTHELNVPDFAKKYNAQVLVDETIIGVPYGDADDFESKYGVVFDTVTKQSRPFDIEIGYGGKYRFKCGIAYKGRAIFLPSGTPGLPIISVATDGTFHATKTDNSKLFGRPIIYKEKLYTLVFNTIDNTHSLVTIDEWLRINEVIKI